MRQPLFIWWCIGAGTMLSSGNHFFIVLNNAIYVVSGFIALFFFFAHLSSF
jgi:hypothetical protein